MCVHRQADTGIHYQVFQEHIVETAAANDQRDPEPEGGLRRHVAANDEQQTRVHTDTNAWRAPAQASISTNRTE